MACYKNVVHAKEGRVNSSEKDWYAFTKGTIIHGYPNSTAQVYAEDFGYDFVAINPGTENT